MRKFLGTMLLALGAMTNAHGADDKPFTAKDGIDFYKGGDAFLIESYEIHVNGMIHGALGTQLYQYLLAFGETSGMVAFNAYCPASVTPKQITLYIVARTDMKDLPLSMTVPKVIHDTCHQKDKQS